MTKLKTYEDNSKENSEPEPKTEKSGIQSPEDKKGEMMILLPTEYHPQHPKLRRAICSKTGWRGWV